MKLTLKATIIGGVIFALACLGVAVTGFTSLGGITEPAQLADAKGFAWFWMFLAVVSAALAALAWWMARPRPGDEHE
ncbi:MAG TPA: hypothetical protein VFP44_08290 [Usitatibacter sp.]|nr:hypothetical protein [Usitatibacter sp.]